MIPWLKPGDPPDAFPPVSEALTDPDGLLCVGGDLSVPRLLSAYRRGIFPWYSEGQPILWWCPDPRAVLFPREFRISRSLAKTLRNRGYRSTLDQAFPEVIARCADTGLRPEGTWISPGMRKAYQQLHDLGYAHSVETWDGDRLVGGLYGIALGEAFFGESMFSVERDASKVALKRLADELDRRGFELIDCQIDSDHLRSLGARLISRAEFTARLRGAIGELQPGAAWR
jgi:leucyl/phenylalanyl-tRNA--protein transferase